MKMYKSNRNDIEQENLTKLLEVHKKIGMVVGLGTCKYFYIRAGNFWFGLPLRNVSLKELKDGFTVNAWEEPRPPTRSERSILYKYIVRTGKGQYSHIKFVEGGYEGVGILKSGIRLNDTEKIDEFVRLCEDGKDIEVRMHGGRYGREIHFIKNKEVTLCKRRFETIMEEDV